MPTSSLHPKRFSPALTARKDTHYSFPFSSPSSRGGAIPARSTNGKKGTNALASNPEDDTGSTGSSSPTSSAKKPMTVRSLLRQATRRLGFDSKERARRKCEPNEEQTAAALDQRVATTMVLSHTTALSDCGGLSPDDREHEDNITHDGGTEERGTRGQGCSFTSSFDTTEYTSKEHNENHQSALTATSSDALVALPSSKEGTREAQRSTRPAQNSITAGSDTGGRTQAGTVSVVGGRPLKYDDMGTVQPIDKSARKSEDERKAVRVPRPESVSGNAVSESSPLRMLSKMLGLNRGSVSAAPLEWRPYEDISRNLAYFPRGRGRAFAESYELGAVLGSGGFAEVKSGAKKGVRLFHSNKPGV